MTEGITMRLATASLALFAVITALPAWGLSLGEVKIYSRLGQPLFAEIPIHDADNITPEQLKATIADPDTMRARHIDVSSIPTDIHIEVRGKNRPTQIRLTTRRPIREPGFELLLKVDWPEGTVMRRYQLLFSPFH